MVAVGYGDGSGGAEDVETSSRAVEESCAVVVASSVEATRSEENIFSAYSRCHSCHSSSASSVQLLHGFVPICVFWRLVQWVPDFRGWGIVPPDLTF